MLSALLATACIIGAAGCGGGGRGTSDGNTGGNDNSDGTTTTTTVAVTEDPNKDLIVDEDLGAVAENYDYNEKNEAGAGENYKKGEAAGKIRLFMYYQPTDISPEKNILPLFAERFGGTYDADYKQAASSSSYLEELNVLVLANDAPDIIRMEWPMLPGYIIKNSFESIDGWIDFSDPIWDSIKSEADGWSYKGKHYYCPISYEAGVYGVGYNSRCIEELDMEDPMDLYDKNEWTWNVMEEMLKKWMSMGSDKLGLTPGSSTALMFATTTGVAPLQFTGNDIINNIKDPKIYRAMEFCERINRLGYVTGFISPESLDAWSGKLLFTVMPFDWTLDGQKAFFDNNLEGELRVVPLPRDPESDVYYYPISTYGYFIPTGAKNMQGATAWLLAARIYKTDPEVIEQDRKEKMWTGGYFYDKCSNCGHVFESRYGEIGEVCPECDTPRKERWHKVYTERQLQILEDTLNPEKFTFVRDCHRGFGTDIENIFHDNYGQGYTTLFDTPFMTRTSVDTYKTYTQVVDESYEMLETLLDNYRELLK